MRYDELVTDERNPFGDVETDVQKPYAAPAPRRVFVIVVERGTDAGKRLLVDASAPGPLLVGHSAACALPLEDPMVSRRHLSLEATGAVLRLKDLDSKNGTRVGGVRAVDVKLEGGERIEIGETTMRVELASAESAPVAEATGFERVLGSSLEMRRLYPLLARLAASEIPVVIEGETGTGKEAVAEAIHEASSRAAKPFVVFDCTAAAPTLLESELFGHERGAFTGAVGTRAGVFQQADGGTLLIDEIGDLDLSLQAKLLRAIDRSEVRSLGGSRAFRVDVRVLAATRRDLDREVQEGRFRDDLYHRLAIARVELPPLRRRGGDIALLARHFWRSLSPPDEKGAVVQPPPSLIARWERDPWPGNVRQLRNAVARQLALGDLDTSTAAPKSGFPEQPADGDLVSHILSQGLPLPVARERIVHAFEKRYIERALEIQGGSVVRAAQSSGIALRYFQLLRSRRSS